MTWIGQVKKDYWHAQVSALLYNEVNRFDLIFTLFYCVLWILISWKMMANHLWNALKMESWLQIFSWDVCGRHRLACRWIPHLQQDTKRLAIGALLARKPIPLSRAVSHLRESSNSIESTLRYLVLTLWLWIESTATIVCTHMPKLSYSSSPSKASDWTRV